MQKRCSRCREEKSAEHFYRHKRAKSGLSTYCKPCNLLNTQEWAARHPEWKRRLNREWKEEHRIARRDAETSRTYGVPRGTYTRLLAEQEGKCAICQRVPVDGRPLGLDHCHGSGRARSLLCNQCNSGIGMLNDDPALCRKAAEYLDSHQAATTRLP